MSDRLRLQLYRAIHGYPVLEKAPKKVSNKSGAGVLLLARPFPKADTVPEVQDDF